jgi:hypothetical protein
MDCERTVPAIHGPIHRNKNRMNRNNGERSNLPEGISMETVLA